MLQAEYRLPASFWGRKNRFSMVRNPWVRPSMVPQKKGQLSGYNCMMHCWLQEIEICLFTCQIKVQPEVNLIYLRTRLTRQIDKTSLQRTWIVKNIKKLLWPFLTKSPKWQEKNWLFFFAELPKGLWKWNLTVVSMYIQLKSFPKFWLQQNYDNIRQTIYIKVLVTAKCQIWSTCKLWVGLKMNNNG